MQKEARVIQVQVRITLQHSYMACSGDNIKGKVLSLIQKEQMLGSAVPLTRQRGTLMCYYLSI